MNFWKEVITSTQSYDALLMLKGTATGTATISFKLW